MSKTLHSKPEDNLKKPRGRKPHSKIVRGLIIAAISLLSVLSVFMIGGGIYLWRLVSLVSFDRGETGSYVDSIVPDDDSGGLDIDYVINDNASDVADIPLRSNTKNITNYLLIGIDARADVFTGLADSVIILTIDKGKKEIKLTSILRDTLVTIPGRDKNGDGKDDYGKFNWSFSFGGFQLLSKTIEQNFRLKIDKYITINFAAFSAIVDELGGVDMALTAAEADHIHIGKEAKVYHLNGYFAREYSRTRMIDSDFKRTDRQKKVFSALFQKLKVMNIGQLNSILNKTLPKVDTNMSPNEFTNFTFNSMTYFGYSMDKSFHLPITGAYRGDKISGIGDCLILTDPVASVIELHKFVYNS